MVARTQWLARRPVGRSAVVGGLVMLAIGLLAITWNADGKGVGPTAPLGSETACKAYGGLPAAWRQDPRAGMVRIRGGEFVLGSQRGYRDEMPAQRSKVADFWIDRTEVTNAQFASFVAATGYITEAEREGGGAVFVPLGPDELGERENAWWRYAKGATWRTPGGPGSNIRGRDNNPVVMVTRNDAQAYATWLGRSLPTEIQWEYAAKAGREDAALDEVPRQADGKPAANFWQGMFPLVNNQEDGYAGLAPVGCFGANAFGLHDSIGNVWEWTQDPYRGAHQPHGNGDPGKVAAAGATPHAPAENIVIKGGSFLCAENYCMRYRAAARHPHEANLATAHVGFRTVSRADR